MRENYFQRRLRKFKVRLEKKRAVSPDKDAVQNILNSACAFMNINFQDHEKIAKQFHDNVRNIEKHETQQAADAFWINDVNFEWLCLNLVVQTQWYNDIFSSLVRLKEMKNVQSVYDYGCGSGAFSILLDDIFHFKKLVLSDLDNYSSSFIRYYIESERKKHINWENILESTEGKYDMLICLDVLEHIEDSYSHLIKLDSKLNEGGVLVLKIAFECEDKTHLPKAAKNFFIENDGYGFLNKKYKKLKDFFYNHGQLISGIYVKNKL